MPANVFRARGLPSSPRARAGRSKLSGFNRYEGPFSLEGTAECHRHTPLGPAKTPCSPTDTSTAQRKGRAEVRPIPAFQGKKNRHPRASLSREDGKIQEDKRSVSKIKGSVTSGKKGGRKETMPSTQEGLKKYLSMRNRSGKVTKILRGTNPFTDKKRDPI